MPSELVVVRNALYAGRVEWRKHVLQRDVIQAAIKGEAIRTYPEDRPFPSMLLLGWINTRPLHVVCSYDERSHTVFVITVYEPSPDVFEADFKTRKA